VADCGSLRVASDTSDACRLPRFYKLQQFNSYLPEGSVTAQRVLILIILLSISQRAVLGQQPGRTLTNTDIINMAKSGIGEQTIVLTIQKNPTKFDTSPEALIQLKTAGVSDAVLNAMLDITPAATPSASVSLQDCSPTLDKLLSTVGTPERIAVIHSIKAIATNVVDRASGRTTFHMERITVFPNSIYISVQPSGGVVSTAVLTPAFNYMNSGKMTTAVPEATLQELQMSLKLELIYIAQHRNQYSCVFEGTEQIGNVATAKLKIHGEAIDGEFYFDPAAGRLIRSAFQSHPSAQVVTDFSDWRPVDQISLPFRRHVSNQDGTIDTTISEYQLNPSIDAGLFQPPASQPASAITFKVTQSESVPYVVQTNGGISTACNISGSTNTTMTASTYGNTTYGSATSNPNLQMNCRSSDTTIRWTHVLNAMFVQASDGNAYIIACDRAWRWSKCTPLKVGDTFLAKRTDKRFLVQSVKGNSKEQEATYTILQSKSLHE